VTYRINPWMDPDAPVDRRLALSQWQALREVYEGLGHTVEVVPPVAGLPDMVFAANGALVVAGRALGVRFANAQRAPEAAAYLRWLVEHGHPDAVLPSHVNEGEGDFLVAGDVILAGTGFRTHPLAHAEVAAHFGCEVLSLELVDPSYYHLDTAMCVLDDRTIAYLPEAFSAAGRALLAERFPDAIQAGPADAACLGLNAVSDGRNVILNIEARELADQLADAGFTPLPVDLSELRKAGGGPKCCTLELRRQPHPVAAIA
jgi:N-dimethylarginine dimethylaminohydrolase